MTPELERLRAKVKAMRNDCLKWGKGKEAFVLAAVLALIDEEKEKGG